MSAGSHTVTRRAMTSLFVLSMGMAACGIAESAETSVASKDAPDTQDATALPARSLSLADIAAMLEAVDKSEREMRQRLAESARDEEQASEVDAAAGMLLRARRVDANAPADLVEYFEAADLDIAIRTILNRLASTIDATAARAKQLDEDLDRLASDSAKSTAWLATARRRQAPAALLAAIEMVPNRSDELAREIKAERDRLLQILDRAQALRRAAEISQAEAAEQKGSHRYASTNCERPANMANQRHTRRDRSVVAGGSLPRRANARPPASTCRSHSGDRDRGVRAQLCADHCHATPTRPR